MKSYNHLYEKFISEENILQAVESVAKSHGNHPKLISIMEMDKTEMIMLIENYASNFHHFKHCEIPIYDGISKKQRIIIVPSIKEQILHHMIVNTLKPVICKGMYEFSCGSIPDRGPHYGKRYIEKAIKYDKRNIKYCLKMDVQKFFNSIPHDILKFKFQKYIHDEIFLKILYEVIDTTESGLPLGFYTSQWFANWYLQGLDHFIKEDMGMPYYVRYMDDMVIFCSNKRVLHEVRRQIENYLNDVLGLNLKSNWQVFRFDYIKKGERNGRFLDFMGFRFYRDKTTLRRNILLKITRKALKMHKKEKYTIYDIRQLLSYMGWINCTDSYQLYVERIKSCVNIKYCKKKISRYDKLMNNKEGEFI